MEIFVVRFFVCLMLKHELHLIFKFNTKSVHIHICSSISMYLFVTFVVNMRIKGSRFIKKKHNMMCEIFNKITVLNEHTRMKMMMINKHV